MYRYIGNKTKLLEQITSLASNYLSPGGTVADLMAGTGSVAAEFRRLGYRVIASDIMTYSKWHLYVQLLMNRTPSFEGLSDLSVEPECHYVQVLNYLNELEPVEGYFFREFSPSGLPANGCPSRKYFTSDNAAKIDAIRLKINEWRDEGRICQMEEALLRHTLIMAVNEVANISGTYGYFLANFSASAKNAIHLAPVSINTGRIDNVVLQGRAEDLAAGVTADLCYLDPPYIKRQYAANYHILETVARGDEPVAAGKSGLRPWRDQYSDLCTKTKSKDSFAKIIEDIHCPVCLISYSEDGLFPVEDLCDVFSAYGKIEVKEIAYKRFRSNCSSLANEIKEFIIVLEKW